VCTMRLELTRLTARAHAAGGFRRSGGERRRCHRWAGGGGDAGAAARCAVQCTVRRHPRAPPGTLTAVRLAEAMRE
jgi:hypothetical protein